MRLLQVSDPHFGTERPEVVLGLLRLARDLVPDVVVLSGDVTQRARRAQFDAARRFTDALLRRPANEPPGVLLVQPGNHDIPLFNLPARLLWPYAGLRRAFGPALRGEWQGPSLQLTLLDTTRRWRHKNGELSNAQIEAVAARLRRASPAQLRVVVAHHPVAVPRESERHNLARGHARALRRWAEAGADLVLGGHIHLPAVMAMHEQISTLPRRLWVVQAGTALSARVRHEADNSVNLVRLVDAGAARRCRIERWDWRPQADAFEPGEVHELDCSPALA